MFKKNLFLSLRLMGRNKLFSFLNIVGLAFGLACTILLYLWITDELQYNSYHENVDRIHLVQHWQHYGDEDFDCWVGPGPMAKAFKETYPEVEEITRFQFLMRTLVTANDKNFTVPISAGDPGYLNIFTCPVIYGSYADFQNDPTSIVITESISRQFFGDEDPIGEIMVINDEHSFTVKTVIEDFPDNVNFTFELMLHFTFMSEVGRDLENWHNNFCYNLALLEPGVDYKVFEEKIVTFMDEMKENDPDNKNEMFLNPLNRLHLYDIEGGGRIVLVKVFGLVTIFILLLACFNYTNLSTARASNRSKEIAIRKVMSASKRKLIFQFLGESFIFTFIALNFSLILVRLFLPAFNNISGKELIMNYTDPFILTSLFGFWVITSILAGLYPAFVLSSFGVIKSLKDSKVSTGKGGIFRKALVILQFTFSIGLIILTILIMQQVQFMKNMELGYNKENMIYIRMEGKMNERFDMIKNKLLENPDIISMCRTSHYNATNIGSNGGGWNWEGKDPNVNPLVYFMTVDYDYLETFHVKLNTGRFFSEEFPSDTSSWTSGTINIIINQTFAEIIGAEGITERILSRGGEIRYNIIGVVDDFRFQPNSRKMEPIAIYCMEEYHQHMFIRVNGNDITNTLSTIESTLEEFNPGFIFNYGFMDDALERNYRGEERYIKIFKAFAIFAIIISCLGLFGLAAFAAQKRTKEIGIRKAMGGTVSGIIVLLSKDMTKWILLSNLFAWPVAYFVFQSFLEQFPYKVGISVWVFVLSGLASFMLSVLTVMYHAYSASQKNPVDSLRYE